MSPRILTPLILVISALLSGCSALSLFYLDRQNLDLTEHLEEINSIARANAEVASCSRSFVPAFQKGTLSAANLMTSIPGELRITKVMNALAEEYRAVLDPTAEKVEFALDTTQFEIFARALPKTLYSPASQITDANIAARTDQALDVFKAYFKTYIYGEFVDSRGTKLSKPNITARGIGNESISAALIVLLEAVADSVLKTPVFYTQTANVKAYLNPGKAQPTGAKLGRIPEEAVVNRGKCGVTEGEAKAIAFLSELAADQAEFVSGMIVESFGGGEGGFILAGHFSVGDNKTLATVVKTFFENVFRRASAHILYEVFKKRDFPVAANFQPAADPLYQELDFLKELQQLQ